MIGYCDLGDIYANSLFGQDSEIKQSSYFILYIHVLKTYGDVIVVLYDLSKHHWNNHNNYRTEMKYMVQSLYLRDVQLQLWHAFNGVKKEKWSVNVNVLQKSATFPTTLVLPNAGTAK